MTSITSKYGKYFVPHEPGRKRGIGVLITSLDDTVIKGSYYYSVHWVLPSENPPMPVGHPPHMHKDAELLFHIGTNPDDPADLGAEVEMFMGPELERHVITTSTLIYVPPRFIHGPWRPLKTVKPWIFVQVLQGPTHTEKLCPEVLPEELRGQVDWSRWQALEAGFD